MAGSDGLLADSQIRGVDPLYQYRYKEYPKALSPPMVTVKNASHEERLRGEWRTPLPWDNAQEKPLRDKYYAEQTYPKEMQPPQVHVGSLEEEESVLASWNVAPSTTSKTGDWPLGGRYMFHPKKGGKLVRSRAELNGMGDGWYDTPEAAIAAAGGTTATAPVEAEAPTDPDKMSREQMFAFLKARAIPAGLPITNDVLRERVKAAIGGPAEPGSVAA